MSAFDSAPIGTVLIYSDDGSAIVKGDGSDEEALETRRILEADGDADEETVAGIMRVLDECGLALKVGLTEVDSRAFPVESFMVLADMLGNRN